MFVISVKRLPQAVLIEVFLQKMYDLASKLLMQKNVISLCRANLTLISMALTALTITQSKAYYTTLYCTGGGQFSPPLKYHVYRRDDPRTKYIKSM